MKPKSRTSKSPNPDGIKSVYANNATLLATANDIRIVFGEIVVEKQNTLPRQELRANVVMTVAQAEALSAALVTAVENTRKLQAANDAQAKKA